ncbi:hypothetical protein Srufu_012310 [Streptomyces libani subsp. rufus]|nr:hypothetical protein Srufu_012310 [Streptomyces libani subsp. rufus]
MCGFIASVPRPYEGVDHAVQIAVPCHLGRQALRDGVPELGVAEVGGVGQQAAVPRLALGEAQRREERWSPARMSW